MITSAVAALAFASLTEAKPKITAVSMFKNGYSFVARETNVPASGEYIVEEPPMAAHGTFWHLPSDGVSITNTSSTTIDVNNKATIGSIDSLIELNKGVQVAVDFVDLPS